MTYIYRIVREKVDDLPAPRISSSRDAYDYLAAHCFNSGEMYRERSFLLLMNNAHGVVGHVELSAGGIDSTVVDNRIACKYAVGSLARYVILAHNHPSGDVRPGTADIKATESLKRCLGVFDIEMTDHIIIGDGEFFSFAEEASFKPISNNV